MAIAPQNVAIGNPYLTKRKWEEQGFTPQFREMIANMNEYWRKQGIEWRVGLEHEFRFYDDPRAQEQGGALDGEMARRSKAIKVADESDIKAYIGWLEGNQESLDKMPDEQCIRVIFEQRKNHHIAFGPLKQTRTVDHMDEDPLTYAGAAAFEAPESASAELQYMRNIISNRSQLKQRLLAAHPKDAKAIERLSLSEMIMAELYDTPQTAGLLEHRDIHNAKQDGGVGYYDIKPRMEIRTKYEPPTLPPLAQEAPEVFDTLLNALTAASRKYGVSLFHDKNTHINLGAFDCHTHEPIDMSKNIRSIKALDGSVRELTHHDFHHLAAEGAYHMMQRLMPVWGNYPTPAPNSYILSMGNGRLNDFRMHGDVMEFRLPTYGENRHDIATQIMSLMAGVTWGVAAMPVAYTPDGTIDAKERFKTSRNFEGDFRSDDRLRGEQKELGTVLQHMLNEASFKPICRANSNKTTYSMMPGNWAHQYHSDVAERLFHSKADSPYAILPPETIIKRFKDQIVVDSDGKAPPKRFTVSCKEPEDYPVLDQMCRHISCQRVSATFSVDNSLIDAELKVRFNPPSLNGFMGDLSRMDESFIRKLDSEIRTDMVGQMQGDSAVQAIFKSFAGHPDLYKNLFSVSRINRHEYFRPADHPEINLGAGGAQLGDSAVAESRSKS